MLWKNRTPYSKKFKDNYSSLKGPIEESKEVYIKANNLISRWKKLNKDDSFTIGEMGFGTGLNFLLTSYEWLEKSKSTQTLHYVSIEKYPVKIKDLIKAHSEKEKIETLCKELISDYPVNCLGNHRILLGQGRIQLTLIFEDVLEALGSIDKTLFDAWYLDGFSPDRNPDMWTKKVLSYISDLSHKDTTFSTFSSSSLVKENLSKTYFKFEKITGFGTKRHMLKGKKKGNLKRSPKKTKKIAIIGAGLAGCVQAYILSKRGHEIDLYEENNTLVGGASGNPVLVTYPRFSPNDSLHSRFYLHSFLFSSRFYKNLASRGWSKTGVVVLSYDEQSRGREALLNSHNVDKKLFRKISRNEASKLTGIDLDYGGLFFPNGGIISPKDLCEDMVNSSNVNIFSKKTVSNIEKINRKFYISINDVNYEYDHICLCNSFDVNKLIKLNGISKKRGQITYLKDTPGLENLRMPICSQGYISPDFELNKILGSTYNDFLSLSIKQGDNLENIKNFKKVYKGKVEAIGARAGYRAVTQDKLPFCGQYQGFYINTGHGSRGSISIPMTSVSIADEIDQKPNILPRKIKKAINPERFN